VRVSALSSLLTRALDRMCTAAQMRSSSELIAAVERIYLNC